MTKITGFDSAKACLEYLEPWGRLRVSARSALRALPALSYRSRKTFEKDLIVSLRTLLNATLLASNQHVGSLPNHAVLAFRIAKKLKQERNNLILEARSDESARDASNFALMSIKDLASSALKEDTLLAARSVLHGTECLKYSGYNMRPASDLAWEAASLDFSQEKTVEWAPLWLGQKTPKQILEAKDILFQLFFMEPEKWEFWAGWYEGFLRGEPLPWPFIQEIALNVTESDWEAGPAHVTERIREIEAKFDLEARINQLEQKLSQMATETARRSIGGNAPPEDMQIEPQIVRETTIIWASLDELKAETEKKTPNKSTVLRSIETLGRALKAILAWLAQKGDLSVDTLIKWGIPLGGAAVLANPSLVADVIEAAKAWVAFLP